MAGVAISYIRYSSEPQGQGDSLRRQLSKTVNFCTRHGLTLDEGISYQDLGVSAGSGRNVSEGDLGRFLDAALWSRPHESVKLSPDTELPILRGGGSDDSQRRL